MSMEDILKMLVDSRQQGASSQDADPMGQLVGSLLGGGSGGQGAGLGQMMGALESVMDGGQAQQGGSESGMGQVMGLLGSVMGGGGQGGGDPIMALLTPFVAPLAKKANIEPAIAMAVVSFVVHKLLAHHPTSGRDSNSFDLDDLMGQMANGKINSDLLKSSGMINELSKKTGLDEATAAKSLDLAFMMVGKTAGGLLKKRASKPAGAAKASVSKSVKGAAKLTKKK